MAQDTTLAGEKTEDSAQWGNVSADRLRSLIERIERLEEERKALGSDIKDIFAEAKSAGFDVKVMRQLIRIRKQEPADVVEQETLLDVYRRALGMNKTDKSFLLLFFKKEALSFFGKKETKKLYPFAFRSLNPAPASDATIPGKCGIENSP